jgi:signal transduction histidine kinase
MDRSFVARIARGRYTAPIIVTLALATVVIGEMTHRASIVAVQRSVAVNDLVLRLSELDSLTTRAEADARTYVAGAQADDLALYERSIEAVRAAGSRLVDLAGELRGAAADTLVRATDAMNQRSARMQAWVDATRAGRSDDARALVRADLSGQARMSIRLVQDAVLAQADAARKQQRSIVLEKIEWNRWLGNGLLVLLAGAALMLLRQVKRTLLLREGEKRRLVDEVGQQTSALRELAGHIVTAQEAERARLARELHDEMGAVLTACKLEVMRVRKALPDAGQASAKLDGLDRQINRGIALKRDIIENLRPSSLDHLGLAQSLEQLCDAAASAMEIKVDCKVDAVPVSPDAQLAIYRVVQEALTNIAKYARASRVTVRLETAGDAAHIGVADDGIGFEPASVAARHGLRGMRVRVESLRGRLEIDSAPGRGTCIDAWLPVLDDDAAADKALSSSAHPLEPSSAAMPASKTEALAGGYRA